MHQYGKHLTTEKAAYLSKMGVMAREAQRLARADHDPLPIRSGMQMGFIHWDTRTPQFRYHFGMLIDVGYANRYQLIIGGEKQPEPITFFEAVKNSARAFGHIRI